MSGTKETRGARSYGGQSARGACEQHYHRISAMGRVLREVGNKASQGKVARYWRYMCLCLL